MIQSNYDDLEGRHCSTGVRKRQKFCWSGRAKVIKFLFNKIFTLF